MKAGARLPQALKLLAALAEEAENPLYAVGGCVRDALRGARVVDVDVALEGDAAALARAFVARRGGDFLVFDRFGTVRLELKGGGRVDIARARAEEYAAAAALPVVRHASIQDDLARRDFTVNAMARRLTPSGWGKLLDPFGGREDLRLRRLRVLHQESFRDDPTRLFRAARYAGRLGLKADSATLRAVRAAVRAGRPGLLSRERVRQEIVRILQERDPGPAMRLLKTWGLLPAFHPEFRWNPAARKAKGAATRLGLCAWAMPRGAGAEFLKSLPLAREEQNALQAALRARDSGMSPKSAPERLTREIMAAARPKAPASAAGKLLVGGEDLRRRGLAPGREFSKWLDSAAKAQWRGTFASRAAALAWLKARVRRG